MESVERNQPPALIVLTGFAAAAWAKWGRRSAYFTTGRATDADTLPETLPPTAAPTPAPAGSR